MGRDWGRVLLVSTFPELSTVSGTRKGLKKHLLNGQTDEWMDKWMHAQMDRWIEEWMKGWIDEWSDGMMDRQRYTDT